MNRTKLHRPASLHRRCLVLATPLLAGVLPGCTDTVLTRGRESEGGWLLPRQVALLEAREPPYIGSIAALAWSPDGARIAAAGFAHGLRDTTDVMLWDVAARRRIAVVPRASRSRFSFAFTPDSRLLAMSAARPPGAQVPPTPGPDHLSLVDARTGAVAGAAPSGLPPPPPGGTPFAIAVAPAGGRAAAAFAGGPRGPVAVVYDAPADANSWRPIGDFASLWLGAYGRVAFSPDGGRLALAGGKKTRPGDISAPIHLTVEARDLRVGGATGRPAWAADLGAKTAYALAWGSPDGELVAVGLSGNAPAGTVGERVVALDGRTGARRWAARWPAAAVEGLAFSPDGRLLAAASRGDEVRVLDAATGETLLAIAGLRAPRAVAWGPAGPRLLLAFNDGPRVRIAAIEHGK